MNKKLISGIVLAAGMLFSGSAIPRNADAATTSGPAVTWGNMQLVKGQVGKVTILQNTPLYQPDSKKMTTVRTLKKGSLYPVYSVSKFDGVTYYDIGGGCYVKASSVVKYETPPKATLQALGITVTKETLQSGIDYPKITMLTSKIIEAKINKAFYNLALQTRNTVDQLKQWEAQDKADGRFDSAIDYYDTRDYSVTYNQNNIISIKFNCDYFGGGAHGLEETDGVSFNLLTGKQLTLSDVIQNSTQLQKVNQYIKPKIAPYTQYLSPFTSVDLKKDQFYYTNGGIVIVFQEYEWSSYASGILSFKVPYSVFK